MSNIQDDLKRIVQNPTRAIYTIDVGTDTEEETLEILKHIKENIRKLNESNY